MRGEISVFAREELEIRGLELWYPNKLKYWSIENYLKKTAFITVVLSPTESFI